MTCNASEIECKGSSLFLTHESLFLQFFYSPKIVKLKKSCDKSETSKVVGMGSMFYSSTLFNQYIGGWDTSNVENMVSMFFRAGNFNQYIGGWDTSKVTSMAIMFGSASNFNQYIGDWNT